MSCSKVIMLRRPRKEDSYLYFKWINDKKLVEFNAVFKSVSKKKHDEWFKNILINNDMKVFSIVEKVNSMLIGSCSLRKINKVKGQAELQIRIGERFYIGKGYGSEAIRLLVNYGFNKLALNEIYLYVFENNLRALKAYEKNNFKREKLIKNFLLDNGVFKNAFLMTNHK